MSDDRIPFSDQALLEASRRVLELQTAFINAGRHLSECEDSILGVPMPLCPPLPNSDEGKAALDRACLNLLRHFSAPTSEVDLAIVSLKKRMAGEMRTAHAAWAAEWKRRHIESGTTVAEQELEAALDALIAGVGALAKMRATTLDGLLAKALVFQHDPNDDQNDHHYQTLALSVMHDMHAMLALRGLPPTPLYDATTAAAPAPAPWGPRPGP